MEWQPIETAPKKGEYLVYQPLKKHSRSSANDLVARVVPQSHAGLRLATASSARQAGCQLKPRRQGESVSAFFSGKSR